MVAVDRMLCALRALPVVIIRHGFDWMVLFVATKDYERVVTNPYGPSSITLGASCRFEFV